MHLSSPMITKSRIVIIVLIVFLIGFLFIATLLIYAKLSGPPPINIPQTTILYASNGETIGELSKKEKRHYVHLEDISPVLVEATIAIEDKRFYRHHGFDYLRIIAATLADLKAMAKVQGASTITQQYARNLYLEHDKTWKRKLDEALYTIRLETNYDKNDILEGYLNTIYYGHGIYGVEAAANYYFNKSANELTLSEASLLAGIPKGPNYYSPFNNINISKKRQKLVLEAMQNNQFITSAEFRQAVHEPLHFRTEKERERPKIAPFFQDVVLYQLRHELNIDETLIDQGGLHVYTTLDPKMQAVGEKVVAKIIPQDSDIEMALFAMDPKTGDVRALMGGKNYEKSSYNRATQAMRMPGSTMKPLLYYTALEYGYTPATMLRSEETTFTLPDGSTYTPRNFRGYYANKPITLAQALAVSDNVFAVKTHLDIGGDELVKTAQQMGIHSPLENVPSLALGTSAVHLSEMVTAYSHFANGGHSVKPVFITKVTDQKGHILYEQTYDFKQVLNPNKAFVMTHLMTGMFDQSLNGYTRVTGATLGSYFKREIAGKSGSTNSDSWMIGFTPQLSTGVWIGYDNNRDIQNQRETLLARDIWGQFMKDVHEKKKALPFERPKHVIALPIDPTNGKVATDRCPVKRTMYFEKGTEPTEYCTDHILIKNQPPQKEEEEEKKKWWENLFPF